MQSLLTSNDTILVREIAGKLVSENLPVGTLIIIPGDEPPADPHEHKGAQGEVACNTPSRSVTTPVRDAAVAQAPGPADQTAGSGGNVKAKDRPKLFKTGQLLDGGMPSKIVAVLNRDRQTVAEIATAAGINHKRCGIELCRLVKIGKAERAGPGLYVASGAEDAPPQNAGRARGTPQRGVGDVRRHAAHRAAHRHCAHGHLRRAA